jgi:hypothetical protein
MHYIIGSSASGKATVEAKEAGSCGYDEGRRFQPSLQTYLEITDSGLFLLFIYLSLSNLSTYLQFLCLLSKSRMELRSIFSNRAIADAVSGNVHVSVIFLVLQRRGSSPGSSSASASVCSA